MTETVSTGFVPKFPFADVADVYASDTSTDWAEVPAASADRKMSINEALINKFLIMTLLFIKTSQFEPNGAIIFRARFSCLAFAAVVSRGGAL